jgi:hypothetical protein
LFIFKSPGSVRWAASWEDGSAKDKTPGSPVLFLDVKFFAGCEDWLLKPAPSAWPVLVHKKQERRAKPTALVIKA